MNPFNPYSYVSLNGDALTRGVTLALPREQVHALLPYGLQLGPQRVTPHGTHPVMLLYHQISRVHMSIPTLLPSLAYHEHIIAVPYCYLTLGKIDAHTPGPFMFEPRLYLDSVLAVAGGIFYWGFAKRFASFNVTQERFAVTSSEGAKVSMLTSRASGEFQPVASCSNFDAVRKMHDQPLILQQPAGIGPFFVCANFDKNWHGSSVRPLETITHIEESPMVGVNTGTFPANGYAAGIDTGVLGSYELRFPWRLSLPYPPALAAFMR